MVCYEGEERREFLRKRARCILYYRVHASGGVAPDGDDEFEAVANDLSQGGASLSTGKDIPVGAVVHMRWTLILMIGDSGFHPRDLELDGEVRVNTPFEGGQYRLGVRFINTKGSDRELIAEFIAGRPGPLS